MNTTAATGAAEPAVRVEGLRKEFPAARTSSRRADSRRGSEAPRPSSPSPGTIRAVDDVTLTAQTGRVTAVLGANGAGKTTTLSCAQGLVKPTSGVVRLLGQDPWNASAALRSRVGIMLQDGGLPQAIRPIPLLRHVASMYRRPADLDALIQRLGIDGFDGTSIRRLSGGQKQRVSLAAALVGRPEVLFLDEPSAGLDPQSRRVVFDLIRETRDAGTAIVLTTHLMDDAQRLADYVYIVDAGRNVAEGKVEDLLSMGHDSQTLRFTLDTVGLTLEEFFDASLHHGLTVSETSPGHYEVSGPVTAEHLAALTDRWARSGTMPHRLELAPRTLEDLFLEISGKDIR